VVTFFIGIVIECRLVNRLEMSKRHWWNNVCLDTRFTVRSTEMSTLNNAANI